MTLDPITLTVIQAGLQQGEHGEGHIGVDSVTAPGTQRLQVFNVLQQFRLTRVPDTVYRHVDAVHPGGSRSSARARIGYRKAHRHGGPGFYAVGQHADLAHLQVGRGRQVDG